MKTMIKLFGCVAFILLSHLAAMGAEASLTVRVRDDFGKPLADVTVQLFTYSHTSGDIVRPRIPDTSELTE